MEILPGLLQERLETGWRAGWLVYVKRRRGAYSAQTSNSSNHSQLRARRQVAGFGDGCLPVATFYLQACCESATKYA